MTNILEAMYNNLSRAYTWVSQGLSRAALSIARFFGFHTEPQPVDAASERMTSPAENEALRTARKLKLKQKIAESRANSQPLSASVIQQQKAATRAAREALKVELKQSKRSQRNEMWQPDHRNSQRGSRQTRCAYSNGKR